MKTAVSIKSLFLATPLLIACTLQADFGPTVVVPAVDALQRYSNLPGPVARTRLADIPQRFEGATVVVALTVTADGRAKDITEVTPLPRDLRSALLAQVAQWQFEPARNKDGQPVALRIICPLTFQAEAAASPKRLVKQSGG